MSVKETGIVTITREAGIVRELFYYYFPDKESLQLAVAELYADEAFESFGAWCDSWRGCDWGDTQQVEKALIDLIGRVREYSLTPTGERKPMSYVLHTPNPHADFYHKLNAELWRTFCDEPALKGFSSLFVGSAPADSALDFFELILLGIQSYIYEEATTTDAQVARVVFKMILGH